MNLTVPQVVSQMVASTAWAAGSALTAKFVREKPLTGLMFGTAYSLITLPINLATQSFYSNFSSPSEEAKRQPIAAAQMVIATFIGAKMVNLFGRPLTPIRAYRIQFASMGLWSTIGAVIYSMATNYFYFVNHSPEPERAVRDQMNRLGAELGVGEKEVKLYEVAIMSIPFSIAVSAIVAKCIGDKASNGAWFGAMVGGSSRLMTQLLSPFASSFLPLVYNINRIFYCNQLLNWTGACTKFNFSQNVL